MRTRLFTATQWQRKGMRRVMDWAREVFGGEDVVARYRGMQIRSHLRRQARRTWEHISCWWPDNGHYDSACGIDVAGAPKYDPINEESMTNC